MPIFRAAVTVGLMLIGAIMVLLGAILLISALSSGQIILSKGSAGATSEIISRITDPSRFWQYLSGLGIVPVVIGAMLARWGWREIQTGGSN